MNSEYVFLPSGLDTYCKKYLRFCYLLCALIRLQRDAFLLARFTLPKLTKVKKRNYFKERLTSHV